MFVGSVNDSVNEDVGTKHGSDLEGEELSLGVTLYILIYGLTGIYRPTVTKSSLSRKNGTGTFTGD